MAFSMHINAGVENMKLKYPGFGIGEYYDGTYHKTVLGLEEYAGNQR